MPQSDTDSTDDENTRYTLARKRRALEQTRVRVRPQGIPNHLLRDDYVFVKAENKSIAAGRRRRTLQASRTEVEMFQHPEFDFMEDFAVFRHAESGTVIWVTPLQCKSNTASANFRYYIFPATMMLKDTKLVQYAAAWKKTGDREAEIAPGMPIATTIRDYLERKPCTRGRGANLVPIAEDDDDNSDSDSDDDAGAAPTLTIVKSTPQPPRKLTVVTTPSPARPAPKVKHAPAPGKMAPPSRPADIVSMLQPPLPAVPSLPKAPKTPGIFDNLPTFTEVAATMPGMPLPILHPPHRAAFTKHMLDALVKNRGDTRTPVQMAAAYALGEIASSKSTHDQLVSVCRDAAIVDSTFFNSQFENPTQCTNGIIMHTSSQKATDLLLPWPLMFAVRASEYSMRVAGRASEEACEALTKKNTDLQSQLDATKKQFDLFKKQAEEERAAAAQKQDEVDALFKDLMGLRERAMVCMQPSRKRLYDQAND